eukprot:1696558-Amphidinium_carterae.1
MEGFVPSFSMVHFAFGFTISDRTCSREGHSLNPGWSLGYGQSRIVHRCKSSTAMTASPSKLSSDSSRDEIRVSLHHLIASMCQ